MVVTGTIPNQSGGNFSSDRVVRYNRQGGVTDLPKLNTGRHDHACGYFVNNNNVKVINCCNIICVKCHM